MKTKIKKLPHSQIELEIELEASKFEDFFEKALSRLKNSLEISGFRKGKVPRDIALREIKQENVLMEAAKLAIEHTYKKAILEKNLEPISQPQIDILKIARKNPFCFRASFAIIPLIELPDYKSIASNIQRKKIFVEDSEIKDALKWLQKSRPRFKELQRPAQKGDFVEIEFSSSKIDPVRDSGASKRTPSEQTPLEVNGSERKHKKNKPLTGQISNGVEKGKTYKDAFILGRGHLIPGFEEQIEGMKKDEEKKFSLSGPESHFQKEIAGKKIDFEVKMNSVKEVEFPEINDQWARGIGNFENLASLRKGIKEGLKIEKEIAETQRIRTKILEEIEKNCKFETPIVLVETEKQRMLEALKQRVSRDFNVPLKDYLKSIHPVRDSGTPKKAQKEGFSNGVKKTEEELLSSFKPEAQKRVKHFLIIREIGKRENIQVSEDEIKQEINQTLSKYPDIEAIQKDIALEKLKDYTKERMRNEKTLAKLESFAIPNS